MNSGRLVGKLSRVCSFGVGGRHDQGRHGCVYDLYLYYTCISSPIIRKWDDGLIPLLRGKRNSAPKGRPMHQDAEDVRSLVWSMIYLIAYAMLKYFLLLMFIFLHFVPFFPRGDSLNTTNIIVTPIQHPT